MFAFALWDRRSRKLFLARDRLGIKPLYYAFNNGSIVFASELKSLSHVDDIAKEIDETAVEDYFTFGYVPDPKSIWRSVRKLAPGHLMLIEPGDEECKQTQYWDVEFNSSYAGSEDDASVELLERLEESVKLRMIADVPLGAFLSGGVDSSAVVATMARCADAPVVTNSISFGVPEFDESIYALAVAELYQTKHITNQVDSDDFSLVSILPDVYDEPFADSSGIPTYRVCQLAREQVTVALSGDGGDENFAGYRRYRWFQFEEKFRAALPDKFRKPIFSLLGSIYPKADWAPRVFRAKATLQAIGRSSVDGYLHGVSISTDAQRERLFSESFRTRLNGYSSAEVFVEHARSFSGEDSLSLVQYLDFKTYLPGDILTKVDRASMAHSLEVRVPVLDHKLVEWIATLPPRFKLNGREGKHVFKKALTEMLPKEILYRSKMGFAVPLSKWFRGALREEIYERILGPEMTDSGIFSVPYLQQVLDEHVSGVRDNSAMIWSLLMFSQFLSRHGAKG
jgi:asparagine synthase (glutamine-hydrolysing)